MQVSKVKIIINKKINKEHSKNIRISLLKVNNLKKKLNLWEKVSKVKFIIKKKNQKTIKKYKNKSVKI